MQLKKIPFTQDTIDQEKINGYLTAMCNKQETRKLAVTDDIAFYNQDKRTYYSGRLFANDEAIVNDKSINQVRIKMGENNYRYFRRIDCADGSSISGLKASAWIEIDSHEKPVLVNGETEIRINFAGYAPLSDMPSSGASDRAVLRNTLNLPFSKHNFNSQSLEALDFVHEIITRWKHRGATHIIYGSHSMGAGNALAAHIMSDLEGINTKSTLALEQIKGGTQSEKLKAALKDKGSEFYRKLVALLRTRGKSDKEIEQLIADEPKKLDEAIANNTISIQALVITKTGGEKRGASKWANNGDVLGKQVYQDVTAALESKQRNKHPDERRPIISFPKLWPEHKLSALLETAKPGNYYELEKSMPTGMPQIVSEQTTVVVGGH